MSKRFMLGLLASGCLMGGVASMPAARAADVPLVTNGLSGVVTSTKGPEAGVWVIAETKDLPTRFIKIVVTDDQGRYVMPDLPKAKYKVWVRGYGLVDSKPVMETPGQKVDLTAMIAPDAKAAAQYYPANYWYALVRPPAASEFPGTGREGNGIAPAMKNQQQWIVNMKEGCVQCHQLGDEITRTAADPSVAGWIARTKQARPVGDPSVTAHGAGMAINMSNNLILFGPRGAAMYSDWTQRIANGEIPPEAPPRPTGVERNVVLTMWDWSEGSYVHDQISTDRRNPTINAYGPVYGASPNLGKISVLDPKTNTASLVDLPGSGAVDDSAMYPHTLTLDQKGRVWSTNLAKVYLSSGMSGVRADYCSDEKNNKYAKYFPVPGRKTPPIVVYDPATKKVQLITSCFGSHHLDFARDSDDTIFFSGDPNVVSWIDTKVWDATHDSQKAEGWCPMVLDTKEKGFTKVAAGSNDSLITPDRKEWNQPASANRAAPGAGEGEAQGGASSGIVALDPKKDTRISGFLYGMEASPKDNSIWYLKWQPSLPTGIVRFERGANPPETCKTEYYEPPKMPDGSYVAFNGRGISVDSQGIVWASFASGAMGRFDRSKCKVLSGPTATGQQCPEGWTVYTSPGPKFQGVSQGSADFHYLEWVDLHNTLGLGKDVPIMPGTNSDALLALMPDTGKYVTLRVPYPMGFYARGLDGRIDDPKAGWRGHGLWASYSDVPTWHQENGEDGSGPEIVHFQLRPSPIAD